MKRPKDNSAPIYLLVILLIFFISWIDKITGFEIRVFVFYFLPIAIGAWNGGNVGGILSAMLAVVGWTYANFEAAGSSDFIRWWNAGVMLVAFLLVALATARI